MVFVTTSRKGKEEVEKSAKVFAETLSAPYLPRDGLSLERMFQESGLNEAVIVGPEGAKWQDQSGRHFFFHPNMAAVRVKALARGGKDALIEASGIQKGDRVLDCTLGLGSDAIVAAHVVGKHGEVTGLESQSVIASLVSYGLTNYPLESPRLLEAMHRVEVCQADYRQFLHDAEENSFDIVLFDPMFRQTVTRSSGVQALKTLANPAPLDPVAVNEACRVAKRRVVLKERKMSGEFERLGFQIEKEASNHAFGIKECGG
ncbi:class I SAM-dependent methyltransferase [Marininema halotolerans]|uniref:Putative SAM-dependent methyltransferase n=1 Tax=Marininema halotolerans TaxID=1155944 RepID=A0A1I6R6M3_9BACL|nr:class I SAM-dependent methyltransferase [Marininema halotolerans]SFS60372.1 Putative SAM-dependent methyltransferase [Marininema halotolerans]